MEQTEQMMWESLQFQPRGGNELGTAEEIWWAVGKIGVNERKLCWGTMVGMWARSTLLQVLGISQGKLEFLKIPILLLL